MWIAQNDKPSIVSIHLSECLCHCSYTRGKTGTFKVNIFLHSFHIAPIKDYCHLLGNFSFSPNVLLA